MTYFSNLFDNNFRKTPTIDNNGKLITADIRRLGGSGFGAVLDTTYQYATNLVGTGAVNLSGGIAISTTGVTANSSVELITLYKLRAEYGKSNNFRSLVRFQQAGAANNISFLRIYVDSNTEFGFRTNGATSATNFEVYYKRAGVITAIANGSFNGNGTQSNQTASSLLGTTFNPTVFNTYEIRYSYSYCIFCINGIAIHKITPSTNLLLTSIVGKMSIGSVNSGGSTTNCGIELAAWGGFQNGGITNNPLFYNCNAVAETRTLKAGGGTLHCVIFGAKGAGSNTVTFYDNTAGSGTVIIEVDLANISVGSTMSFNAQGLNFYNGLTYVSTGTTAKFTVLWE